MTDLRDQLSRLLDNEPEAPYDIDTIVRSGRRARRRHNVALAAASTVGVAGVTAAVMVPLATMGGNGRTATIDVGSQPSATATTKAPSGSCYLTAGSTKGVAKRVKDLIRSGRVGANPSVTTVKSIGGKRTLMVCAEGVTPKDLQKGHPDDGAETPSGPRYSYTEEPAAIATRLGEQLTKRVNGFDLSITYTRGFSQETTTLDKGSPSYFGGNVDVHESSGYADIGVQVTHEVTGLVPFTGDCTAADHCAETKLPDGSILRTGQVEAGKGLLLLTAEVHRPDGVIVQAQESNYPFGPDAGSQPHGDQPLTLDQLVSLATDAAFTF